MPSREQTGGALDYALSPAQPAVAVHDAASRHVGLPVHRIMVWHLAISAFLVAAYLAIQSIKLLSGRPFVMGLVPMFDLDGEANVPAFFQAQGLVLVGVAVLVSAWHEHRARSALALRWLAMALAFFYLGLDEAAMIHDRIGTAFQNAMHWAPDHADWILPMLIVGTVFALWMTPFIVALPRPTLRDFVLAGVVYVGGAVGFELVGKAAALAHGYDSFAYVLSVAGEEGLEMLGIVLFLRAALLHIRRNGYEISVEVT